jgi:hypothetical protein
MSGIMALALTSAGACLKVNVPDSVQIRCTRCRCSFRDRARRIQSGYSRQCPNCEVLIFFEEGSMDKNVQAALLAARKLRRLMREAEATRPTLTAASWRRRH